MKTLKSHSIFVLAILILTLFFLKSILHSGVILDNVHYINDLTFVSYNTQEALKNNELPLWTPYFYAGHPLLAIPENYIFDLNFLFVYLFNDIYLAMNLALVFYFFLAGLGMYILIFNIAENKKAAFVASIIYMFNGFMHSFIISGHINILEGYALIPFIFLSVYKALKSSQWAFYSVIAGILFALQIFSGSLIFFFYTALIVAFFFAFNLIGKNFLSAVKKSVFVAMVIAFTALSLASIKLLPVLEFTKMSSRASGVSFNEFLGHPISLSDIARITATNIGYAEMSAAVGIIAFALVLCGLSRYKKKIVAFSLAIMIFSLLFASGTFIAGLMYKAPGFDKLRHVERSLVLFVFAASILSAYGFIFLSERLKKHTLKIKYFQSVFFQNIFFIAVIFLMLLELLFLQNFPSSAKVIEPNDIKLLEHIGNDNSAFRTMNIAQKEIIGAAGYNYYAQKKISEVKGGGGIWINDYVLFLSIAQQTLSPKILGILNVKYLVADSKIEMNNITFAGSFNKCKDCAVWNSFGPHLYKNEMLLPRYSVVPNGVLAVGDNKLVRQAIYGIMLQNLEPKNTVLVEGTKINDYGINFLKKFSAIILLDGALDESSISKLSEYKSQGGVIIPDVLNGQNSVSASELNKIFNKAKGNYNEINIEQYSNNKVTLDLKGEKGWLVASERFAYFPGWKAGIYGNNNEKKIQMLKADNAISALYLEGEQGKLVFEYKPESYRRGKFISIIAFVFIVGYFGYAYAKSKFFKG